MRLDSYEVSLKKQFIMERMQARGITHVDGLPLDQVDYEDLKRELAIHRCRAVDTDSDLNVWF